ncbi:MAG: discoidin domain-containing protein [Acidobacteria bacterium]|nr:discoidin domain-containing protein [Acidobacteriota bacterium]
MIRNRTSEPAWHPSSAAAAGRPGLGDAAAVASYLLVTAAIALPLLRDPFGLLPGDRADPVLNAWLLWWGTQVAPLTGPWWNAPAFHPYPGVLTYSEHLLGLLPIAAPLQWLTGSPVLAYNVTFLLTFPLSGAAGYVLGRELTGRRDAAWIAGLAFAFAPYRMSHVSHVQVLASFWMPLALAALHRHARDGRPRWLAAFAGATLMQGLTNGYYLAYFPVLVGLWAIWFSPRAGWWRRIARIGAAGVAATLPLVPVLLTYRQLHAEQGLQRSMSEIVSYSADLTALAGITPRLAFWGPLHWSPGPEQELFPGAALAVLIGVALWRARGRQPRAAESRYLRAARIACTALAVLGAGLLAVRLLAGPWAVELLGLRISVGSVDKIGAHAALAATAACLLSRTCAAAWQRRSPFAFYLLAVAALGLCAMGPHPEVGGTRVMAYSPYLGLLQIPGFEALRVPARFWMLALVCLSALAALSYARLAPADGRRRGVFLVVLATGLLLDGWGRLPVVPSPSPSPLLRARAAGPVADLPLGWRDNDAAAMLRGAAHGQPVANGYSGHAPPYYGALAHGLRAGRGDVVGWLAEIGVRHVRVDRTRPGARRLEAAVAAVPGLRLDAHTASEALYTFVRTPTAPPAPALGERLPVVGAAASENEALVDYAIDRAHGPRWTTGPQAPGQWLRLELDASRAVGGVVLWGSLGMEFPRRLRVETSRNGRTWEVAWEGPTELPVLRGALRDPRAPLTIAFAAAPARYVALRQTGRDPSFAWSVTEVDVHGPPPLGLP